MNTAETVRGAAINRLDIPQWAVDRFHRNYVKQPNGCWDWQGARNNKGYGLIRAGKMRLAHRVAFVIWHGELLSGVLVAHQCDRPCCVNPGHLFATDHKGNAADMVAKRRHMMQRRTHCINGHEYTPENTGFRAIDGTRACVVCATKRSRRGRKVHKKELNSAA
jgi:hypothetical protein